MAGEDILRCPVCGGGMTREGNSLFCPKRHCFDIARSGYVTLTRASGTSGDDRDMVRSRTSFLDGGSYERFSDVINSTVSRALETVKKRRRHRRRGAERDTMPTASRCRSELPGRTVDCH